MHIMLVGLPQVYINDVSEAAEQLGAAAGGAERAGGPCARAGAAVAAHCRALVDAVQGNAGDVDHASKVT